MAAASLLVLHAPAASAFDSKGHVVIEALAYRTLIEGHDGLPPRPDVLRDLFDDGDLAPPLCFGWGGHPPGFCADATTTNPLLDWPKPLTDVPDAAFRRQFSDAGQCFHFMATLEDAESPDLEGTTIPRGLATSALVRCRDFLDNLMRQVVLDGGPGTRKGGYGLYELMHAVGDSFSGSHTQRLPTTEAIEELRIWKPLTRLPGLSSEKIARIPDSAFHKWDDHRDKTYVIEDRITVDGRRCKDLTDSPVRGALRVPVRRGRQREEGRRGVARRRARPPRRAQEGIRGRRDVRRASASIGPGTNRGLALLQGPLVRGRLSLPGRRVPGSINPPTSLPARTRSSASTRPTTRRASSSTSRAR